MELHEKQMRQVYSETLVELGRANPRICLLEADLMLASGTQAFMKEFPERFFNVGVAEANMIGIAAGLSTAGKIPFCTTFTSFITRRAYDQITISVAYAKRNVKIVGTDPGITATTNGGTHMCFQDLAIMRVMPGMTVLSPADACELRAMVRFMAEFQGPVYMQLIRGIQPKLFGPEYQFALGRAVILSEGQDVTLVSTGFTTPYGRKAVELLRAKGVSVEHLHYPTVKPFDTETLIASAKKTRFVVSVENQNILGGLGSAVCETLSDRYPVPVKRLGVPDRFGEVGSEEYLMEKHRFGISNIVATLCERGKHGPN
jgi:transketolase